MVAPDGREDDGRRLYGDDGLRHSVAPGCSPRGRSPQTRGVFGGDRAERKLLFGRSMNARAVEKIDAGPRILIIGDVVAHSSAVARIPISIM